MKMFLNWRRLGELSHLPARFVAVMRDDASQSLTSRGAQSVRQHIKQDAEARIALLPPREHDGTGCMSRNASPHPRPSAMIFSIIASTLGLKRSLARSAPEPEMIFFC